METTSNRERDLSLLCLCMTLLFCINEDLKQKVMATLLHALKGTPSISDLVKRFLEGLTGTSGSKGLCFHHVVDKPTSGPADDSKKDQAHSKPLNTASHSARSPLLTPKQPQGCPEPPAKKGRFRASLQQTDFANFIPKRPLTYTVFPAGFLPSLGSSPNDMSSLGSRLASISSLPASCNVSRVRLAQTGFYYDNNNTQRNASNVHELTCYSCGVSYSQWKNGDIPEQIHERLRPDCPHLNAGGSGSISTNNSSVSTNRSGSLTSMALDGRPGLQAAAATTAGTGQSRGRAWTAPSTGTTSATPVAQPQQDDPDIDLDQTRFQATLVAQPQQDDPDIDLDQTRFQDGVPEPPPPLQPVQITSAAGAEQAMGITLRPRVRQTLPP